MQQQGSYYYGNQFAYEAPEIGLRTGDDEHVAVKDDPDADDCPEERPHAR